MKIRFLDIFVVPLSLLFITLQEALDFQNVSQPLTLGDILSPQTFQFPVGKLQYFQVNWIPPLLSKNKP